MSESPLTTGERDGRLAFHAEQTRRLHPRPWTAYPSPSSLRAAVELEIKLDGYRLRSCGVLVEQRSILAGRTC